MENAFAKEVNEVLAHFDVDGETGLSDEQVKRQSAKYGPNGKPELIRVLGNLVCFARFSFIYPRLHSGTSTRVSESTSHSINVAFVTEICFDVSHCKRTP